ncbi:hypothetical protein CEP54_001992 [Fusarium duplospermum]|uniref:Uncharacterized protein n=1 Tax=Fusarium duplospermum TaxID=1325734 RepID=A0A428QXQ8_9HYPO|nr:hypothetical protein CEP54_001992 [Fusarium duplospermum]
MKLSKTLSMRATVNDLTNQATDERNLAVLHSRTDRVPMPALTQASFRAVTPVFAGLDGRAAHLRSSLASEGPMVHAYASPP